MASGDVILTVSAGNVSRDESHAHPDGSAYQEQLTELRGTNVSVAVSRRVPGSSPVAETLFDASKQYKIVITEV